MSGYIEQVFGDNYGDRWWNKILYLLNDQCDLPRKRTMTTFINHEYYSYVLYLKTKKNDLEKDDKTSNAFYKFIARDN